MSQNSTVVLNEQDLEVSNFADPTPKFHNFDASIPADLRSPNKGEILPVGWGGSSSTCPKSRMAK